MNKSQKVNQGIGEYVVEKETRIKQLKDQILILEQKCDNLHNALGVGVVVNCDWPVWAKRFAGQEAKIKELEKENTQQKQAMDRMVEVYGDDTVCTIGSVTAVSVCDEERESLKQLVDQLNITYGITNDLGLREKRITRDLPKALELIYAILEKMCQVLTNIR